MSALSLNRLGAAALIIPAAGVLIFNALLIPGLMPAGWVYPGYLILSMLLVFALTALYIRHLPRSGIILHSGFVLSAVSLFLTIGFNYYATYAFPVLKEQFPDAIAPVLGGPMNTALIAAMVIGFVGNLLVYIAMLRAKDLPRWTAWVLIASALLGLAMLPYNIAGIVASLGMIGAGRAFLAPAPTAMQAQGQPA